MEDLRIVQDGAKSLWIEGPIVVPRIPGTKALALEDILGTKTRPVLYQADSVGRVDDAEIRGEEEAWVQAELDKRGRWIERIKFWIARSGLDWRAYMKQLGLPAFGGTELVHRPTYKVDPADVRATLREAGLPMSAGLKAALASYEELETESLVSELRRSGVRV